LQKIKQKSDNIFIENGVHQVNDSNLFAVTGPWRCILLAGTSVQHCNGDVICFLLVCREAEKL